MHQFKNINQKNTKYQFLLPLLSRATLASAQLERKVSQGSRGLKVVPAAPASPVAATPERPAFAESLEIPVYLGCQANQVYPDPKVSDARGEEPWMQTKGECVDVVPYSPHRVKRPDHTSIPSNHCPSSKPSSYHINLILTP